MSIHFACDRCRQIIHVDQSELRTYKISHENLNHLCEICYYEIVKFIQESPERYPTHNQDFGQEWGTKTELKQK